MCLFTKVSNVSAEVSSLTHENNVSLGLTPIAIKEEFSAPITVAVQGTTLFSDPRVPCVDDFDQLFVLGRGASASVFLVREKVTQRLYALKQAPKCDQSADIELEQHILKSIAALPDAPRSLLPLVASWTDSANYYILTPWCEAKDLSSILANNQRFCKDRVRSYMSQLVAGVAALHSIKVVHRDIKPANILVTQSGHVVLGDFGLAKQFKPSLMHGDRNLEPLEVSFDVDPEASDGSFFKSIPEECPTRERCGTLHWMSPAQHAGTPYSHDADVWALGLLMFRMLTGRLPFGGEGSPAQLRDTYANDPVEFRQEDGIDEDAKDLIRGMLHKDPRARLTIDQVKAHAYFQGIDWSAAARHAGPAPWAPREAYVPKNPRPFLTPGVPHDGGRGEFPGFVFVQPGFFKLPPGPLKAFALKVAHALGGRDKSSKTDKMKTEPAGVQIRAKPTVKEEEKSTVFVDVPLHSTVVHEKIKTGGQDTAPGVSSPSSSKTPGSSLASKVWSFFCRSPPPRPCIVKANIVHLISGRPLVELPTDTTSSSLDRRIRESEGSLLWTMLRSIFARRSADPAVANSGKSSGNSPHKAGATSRSNNGALGWFRRQFRRVKYRAFKNSRASIACSPLPPVYAYYARMLEFEFTRTSDN